MNSKFKGALLGAALIVASAGSLPVFADHHHHHDYDHFRDNMSWEEQREVYNHNWRRMNRAHQRELDAEMRAQWMAYHHNSWNGGYGWNNYNNPAFLDYLHTNNPGLLQRVTGFLGI